MNNFVKKTLKFAGASVLLIALVIGGVIAKDQYDTDQWDKAQLTFNTTEKWVWHYKYKRIQKRTITETSRSILRKVNIRKNYIIYAYKLSLSSLALTVAFPADCTPGKEIVTSKVFPNGSAKTLLCNPRGDLLIHRAVVSNGDFDLVWSGDLDGFSFSEDIGDWDFSVLDKEITLAKAK